jgi:parallel beta-helix repeat protein
MKKSRARLLGQLHLVKRQQKTACKKEAAMWRDVSKRPYNRNIQKAVDAASKSGDTVYIPAGTYPIDETIRLPTCVSLVGDGFCSIIQLNSNRRDNVIVADGYPFASDTWSAGTFRGETRNLHIANLRIRGNGTATGAWQYIWGGCGIMLLAATDCIIENCWIENCYREGIVLSTGMGIDNPDKIGSLRNVIRNCHISGCGGNGIDLTGGVRNEAIGSNFALIEGCYLENNGIQGIRVVNSRFVRVVNNTVVGGHEDGIRIDQCTHILVIGNVVLDNTVDSNGIKFSHSLYCSAIGNACHNNNKPNLELLNSQWCMLAHNMATESDEWGIISRTQVSSSQPIDVDILPPYQDVSTRQYQVRAWINTGHTIEGNLAGNNGSGGIALEGTQNSIVSGNVAALNNQSHGDWGVAGIQVTGELVPSVENIVADNRCYDDQENQTQEYGLNFGTGPNLVIGNDTVRNRSAGFVDYSDDNNVTGSQNNR